jgi:hypothetical protein
MKYKSLKLLTLMSKQQQLLKNSISEYMKRESTKRAIVVYRAPPSSIIPYCPTTRNILYNCHSSPNIA